MGERRRDPPVAQLTDARPITGSAASGTVAAPGMSLRATSSGLTLTNAHGEDVRRWCWTDVEGWDADGVAPDGDGHVRQVLTIRACPAHVVVLADARLLGRFLAALTDAHAAGRRRAASASPRRRTRRHRIAGATALLALACGIAGGAPSLFARSVASAPSVHRAHGLLARELGTRHLHLAKATTPPAPAPAPVAATPLAPHEAFGFLPYWVLPDPLGIDLSSLTTVAYFSVDVTAAGTVDESASNPGWIGYQSQALTNLVTQAHHDGERVVLTASCFNQAALGALTRNPAAQATLASTLVSLVRAKNLDGVNLDFEGTGGADRAGLDQLVATVSRALHAADAGWQFTVDTYASSASDPAGFFDIAGMAPFVDAFVVMNYDMGGTFAAGPTVGPDAARFTDQRVVSSYIAAAGAAKTILGMPLYGEDWPTVGPTAGDPATGPPTPVANDQISPTDTLYWDPATGGPWAVYRVGHQWHQVWFNDPASLAAKAQLVRAAGLRGVALWALGMAVGTGDQRAALTGNATAPQPPDGPVIVWQGPLPGWGVPGSNAEGGSGPLPGAPGGAALGSASAAAAFGGGTGTGGTGGAGAATGSQLPGASGVFDGVDVSLVPWPSAVPSATTSAGSVRVLASPGTSVACLAGGPALPVVQIDGTSAYLAVASTPTDCATGTWAFVLGPGTAGGTSASSGPSTPGTPPAK